MSSGQRPKAEDFGTMVYLVSYGVADDGKSLTEVHIFMAENYLVTVRKSGMSPLHRRPPRGGFDNGISQVSCPQATGRPG